MAKSVEDSNAVKDAALGAAVRDAVEAHRSRGARIASLQARREELRKDLAKVDESLASVETSDALERALAEIAKSV